MKKSMRMIIRNMDVEEDNMIEHIENKLFKNDGSKKDREINHAKLIAEPKHKLIVRSSNASPRAYIEED